MIMKTTKEMIEVMQAYDNGEKIEAGYNGVWVDIDMPEWSWGLRDYRVKQKKYVPFDTAEEFLAAQRAHGGDALITITEDGVLKKHDISVSLDGSVYDHIDDGDIDYIGEFEDLLFEDYKFADGTPCGKEVKSCQH